MKVEYGRVNGDVEKMTKLERLLSKELTQALELKKTKFRKRHPLWEEAVKLWTETGKKCDQSKVFDSHNNIYIFWIRKVI